MGRDWVKVVYGVYFLWYGVAAVLIGYDHAPAAAGIVLTTIALHYAIGGYIARADTMLVAFRQRYGAAPFRAALLCVLDTAAAATSVGLAVLVLDGAHGTAVTDPAAVSVMVAAAINLYCVYVHFSE